MNKKPTQNANDREILRPVLEPGLLRPVLEPGLLRSQAELIAREKSALLNAESNPAAVTADQLQTLIHELQVHQIELELQNEELRQAQIELEISRSRYFDIYDLAPVGYFILTDSGMILEANLTAAGMFGISRGSLTNYTFTIMIQRGDRGKFYQVWKEFLRTRAPQHFDLRMQRLDGFQFWAKVEMSAGLDAGGARAHSVVVSDISERKTAEAETATLALRNQTLLNTATDGIHILDERGHYMDGNPAFCAMLGYSHEELLQMQVADWDVEWSSAELSARINNLLEHPAMFQTRHRRKDGTILNVELNAVGVTLQGCRYLYAASRDITGRKLAEAALQTAHAELEQRVLERTADLLAANESLAKASRAKDEFLSMMSHELRTPLTGVIGMAQVLQLRSYGELNEKQLNAIHKIEESGYRLNRLLETILHYSRLQLGKQEMVFGLFPLNDLCRYSVRKFEKLAAENGKTLEFDMSPEIMQVNMDEIGMHKVLDNLLNNALKFTAPGGRIHLNVLGLPEAHQVRICVSDTGIGIQAQDLPRLFQPFLQLDASLSRKYEGAGMGLALVKLLVDLHGGKMEVESVFGQGSQFTVVLPWDG